MSVTAPAEPVVLHALPGRMRVHLPGGRGQRQRELESQLRAIEGVRRAQANTLTGNVLIQFDPLQTDGTRLLLALGRIQLHPVVGVPELPPSPPPVVKEKQPDGRRRARIA